MANVMIETDFFCADLPWVEPEALRRTGAPAWLQSDSGIETDAAPGDAVEALGRRDEGVLAAFA